MTLEFLLEPRSVAVIGVGHKPGGIGRAIFDAVRAGGFPGPVWPVNPSAGSIDGQAAFASVTGLPSVPDLVVIAVPAAAVPAVVKECAEAGVLGAVIISAGFKESGPDGGSLERSVAAIAREHGLRLLGPNCLGLMVPGTHLNASFAGDMVTDGPIAVVTQSGALGTAIIDWARERGGLAGFASLGNRADLTETDLISAFAARPGVGVVAGYLESVVDGARFVTGLRSVTRDTPVLMLKAGTSEAGARAVSSHTGSLAGSDTAYDAAFEAAGIIRARDVEHLFGCAEAFATQPVPKGQGLVILTNAGGPAVMATDACDRLGVALASLDQSTIDALRNQLPASAALYNPVDVLGDATPERYEVALDILQRDPGVNSILVVLTPQLTTDVERVADVILAKRSADHTTLAVFMGEDAVEPARRRLAREGVPSYGYPERAIDALAAMIRYTTLRSDVVPVPPTFAVDHATVATVLAEARAAKRPFLLDTEVARVAQAYGFPLAPSAVARDRAEAARLAAGMGYPVALKVSSPDILHKTDIGGVVLGIEDEAALSRAWDEVLDSAQRRMPQARVWGALVQKMTGPGIEVVIGVERDATFGPLVMFGLGGVYVELIHDVAFSLAPLDAAHALRLIQRTKAYSLLRGARGAEAADMDAVIDVLCRVSALATDFPEILELDVNPLVVGSRGHGATAADIRIGIGG